MRVNYSPFDLVAFEANVAERFAAKQIPYPVHLSMGNEQQLIDIFTDCVDENDWIFCSWRSHLHCLLKGVPPDYLLADICRGRSIALCYPEYRIFSSAIVGGTAPIAVGVAAGLKARGEKAKCVVFVGDMTLKCGIVREAAYYACCHELPVRFVIEDNGHSVETKTSEVWPCPPAVPPLISSYYYTNEYPHCGIKDFVSFP